MQINLKPGDILWRLKSTLIGTPSFFQLIFGSGDPSARHGIWIKVFDFYFHAVCWFKDGMFTMKK